MTVAELIAQLQEMPQDVRVCINDEGNAIFHDTIDSVFFLPANMGFGDPELVCMTVNEEE
jgi:hypothetical protein